MRNLLSIALVLTLLLATAARAEAETWAQRLGYPADARVVILEAEQIGLAYETNRAAADLVADGHITSVTLMPPCPWFDHAAQWARRQDTIDVGLAFTFNSDGKHYRWRPFTSGDAAASLADAQGYSWSSALQAAHNVQVEQIERELTAQLHAAQSRGIEVSHVTAHDGVLFLRHDLTAAYFRFARRHWIPAAVVELTPEHVERFRRQGFPLDQELIELISTYPMPKLDDLRFAPSADNYEAKREATLKLIAELPAGLTAIKFQPAVESDALKALDERWQQRVWDAKLLADPAVRETLAKPSFVLTNWREIMRRFEGTAPSREPKKPDTGDKETDDNSDEKSPAKP
jgi:chitin disaccharide deacetylase